MVERNRFVRHNRQCAAGRKEVPGTIVVDTSNRHLYYVLPQGKAIRYGVTVGEDALAWSGVARIGRKEEWPTWVPTQEIKHRLANIPDYVGPGPHNPMGARADAERDSLGLPELSYSQTISRGRGSRIFSPVQESSGESWLTSWVSHAAWPQIKMQEHKTARMTQEQQSSASGALLDELFSVSARPASGGCRLREFGLEGLNPLENGNEKSHSIPNCGSSCARCYAGQRHQFKPSSKRCRKQPNSDAITGDSVDVPPTSSS